MKASTARNNITKLFIGTLVLCATGMLSACGDMAHTQTLNSPIAASDDIKVGDSITDQGMVFKSTVEGGFYYIRTSEGKVYVPVGMPAELQNEGVFINFTATKLPDTYSPIMSGELIKIDSFTYPTE